MTRPESITLSISAEEKKRLEQMAFALGYKSGDRPNVSAFIRAIACGEIMIGSPTKAVAAQVIIDRAKEGLKKAISALEELG